jgi:RimJ/RimL family protein N-acetyltransferase
LTRLSGARVVLREWRPEDAPAVEAWADDTEVRAYLVRGAEELRREPEVAMAEAARSPRLEYWLALEHEGGVVGSAVLRVESNRHRRGEIGYVVRRDRWGLGLATEAARLLLAFGFDELRLERVWATCHPRNAASARVLERIGMEREGLLRAHYLAHDGTRVDAVLYAIVR